MRSGMRFYDLPRSPWCQMVRVVLADKGLPHERHIVLPGQEGEDWFRGISPFGLLPVLAERDVVVRGASVINEYLEEAYPDRRLLPNTPAERARVRMLVSLAEELVGTPIDDLHQAVCIDGGSEQALVDELTEEVFDGLGALEEELDPSVTFAAGDRFSLADAALAPFLLGLVAELELESSLTRFPIVRGYRDRIAKRAATAVIRQGWKEWHEMISSIDQ